MSRLWLLIVLAAGCARGAYAPWGAPEVYASPTSGAMTAYDADTTEAAYVTEELATARTVAYSSEPSGRQAAPPSDADAVYEAAPEPRYAQARPATGTTPAVPDVRQTPSSMLIYTAVLVVSVLDVTARQEALVARTREMGGHLAEQSGDSLRVRIPAARFDEFLLAVADIGQVLDRRITVSDVGEEFRDVAIRIQNLEAVRQRFEQMLAQANNVETALAIQRELERVTTELEVLKGRQRYLADQVAFSTVTVHFQALATVYPDQQVNLPFDWLRQLGLRNLLRLEAR